MVTLHIMLSKTLLKRLEISCQIFLINHLTAVELTLDLTTLNL